MRATLAVVLAAFALSGAAATAQDTPLYGEVALEGGFMPDPWTLDLLAGGDRWAGEIDPACSGYINSGPPDLALRFSQPSTALHLSLSAEAPVSLVVRLPNGAWQCTGAPEAIARLTVGKPIPGSYEIWTGSESGFPDARLFVSELTLSDEDLYFAGTASTTATALPTGEPRERLVADAALLDGRVTTLAVPAGGTDQASDFADHCVGSLDRSRPNLALNLGQAVAQLSLYAQSEADTALVVRTPDGTWHCDDDSFGLNPVVTLWDAGPGEVLAWVSLWGGGEAEASLHLRAGDPRWEVSEALLNVASARYGSLAFDPKALEPQSLSLTAGGPMSAGDVAPGCTGHIDPSAADLFVEVPEGVDMLSLYATSNGDLTLVVVGPDGELECDDDSRDLHPAVVLTDPAAGSYSVWVGNWSDGNLPTTFFAAAGEPQWEAALPERTVLDTTQMEPVERVVVTDDLLDGSVSSWPVLAGGPDRAGDFDDSCVGNLRAAAPSLTLELEQPVNELSLYALSEADTALAIQTPDGAWHCDDDSFGLNPAVTLHDIGPGEILAWVSLWGGGSAEATLNLRAGEPRWAAGSGLLEVEESRHGVVVIDSGATTMPQSLSLQAGGPVAAYDFAPSCNGNIDPSAADLFVELHEDLDSLSFYATSSSDLTLVVVEPDGTVLCNDDSYELHPAVTLTAPAQGSYAIWVGKWGPGTAPANFFAVPGPPQWETAVPRLDLEGLSLLEALQASLAFHGSEEEFRFARAEELPDGSVELSDLLVGPPHEAISIARVLIRELDLEALAGQRMPSVVSIEIEGMDLTDNLPDDEVGPMLFGDDPAILDFALDYRYDEAAARGAFNRLMLRVPGKGEITLALAMLGTPPEPEDLIFGFISPEEVDLRLESASLRIHDSGLLRRVLEAGAAEERTSVEALVEVGLAEMAKELEDMGLAGHPATQSLLTAVSAFARENRQPRRLSLFLSPTEPLDPAALFGGMMDPAGLWERLGIQADYAAD